MFYLFPSEESWQRAVDWVESFLIEQLRSGKDYLTYTELVGELNPRIPRPRLDLQSPGDRAAVAELLGYVSARCRDRGEPMLSAVVWRSDTFEPGQGWWPQAKLAGYPVDTPDNRLKAFTTEYRRCLEVYGACNYKLAQEDERQPS